MKNVLLFAILCVNFIFSQNNEIRRNVVLLNGETTEFIIKMYYNQSNIVKANLNKYQEATNLTITDLFRSESSENSLEWKNQLN